MRAQPRPNISGPPSGKALIADLFTEEELSALRNEAARALRKLDLEDRFVAVMRVVEEVVEVAAVRLLPRNPGGLRKYHEKLSAIYQSPAADGGILFGVVTEVEMIRLRSVRNESVHRRSLSATEESGTMHEKRLSAALRLALTAFLEMMRNTTIDDQFLPHVADLLAEVGGRHVVSAE